MPRYSRFAKGYGFCRIVSFAQQNPHFQTIRRYPRPLICGNLSILPSAKTQLHFPKIISQTRLESRFPHEKRDGFHMC